MKLANLLALVIVAGISGAAGFYFGMEREEMKSEEVAMSADASKTEEVDNSNNALLATVDGNEIREDDLRRVYDGLPAQYKQAPFAMIKAQLLGQLVDMQVIQNAALAEGYGKKADFESQAADMRMQMLQQYYIQEKVKEAITDDALKAEYDKTTADFVAAKEVHARHILLKEEDEAKEVIGLLEAGGDFQELATSHSTGPSGPTGGDLGYFVKERMVPEFANAAFEMEKGSYSKEPVKTQFGWHVIFVEDSRDTQPPAFEDVKAEIEKQLSTDTITQLIDSLKEKAAIDIVETPAPEDEEKPAVEDEKKD